MTDNTMKTPGKNEADTPPDLEGDEAEGEAAVTSAEDSEADALKQRLRLRIVFAVALILALLGGLALVDEMNTPAPVVQVAQTVKPASPPPPTAQQVPALTPETESPEASTEAAQETTASPSFPETGTADAAGAPPLRPLTQPATARLATLQPGESARALRPAPTVATELARQAHPAPSASSAPTETTAPPAQASRPLSRASTHTVASGSGYLLQMGVFSSTANAEELRAKLELNGIPAQVESRVQIGPFASRAEAEQMRERLKKLGISEGVLVATRK